MIAKLLALFSVILCFKLEAKLTKTFIQNELIAEHGPSWSSLNLSDNDKQVIYQQLKSMIDDSSWQEKIEDPQARALILNNAITQIGHFIPQESGVMGTKVQKWYQEKLTKSAKKSDKQLYQSYLESLANTGSKEGLDLLLEQSEKTKGYRPWKMIKRHLYGIKQRKKVYPPGIFPEYAQTSVSQKDLYLPNIVQPYYAREGNFWGKSVWKVRRQISKQMRNIQKSDQRARILVPALNQLNTLIGEDLKNLPKNKQTRFLSPKIHRLPTDENKERPSSTVENEHQMRQGERNNGKGPASVAEEDERGNSLIPIGLILFFILITGIYLRKKR
jgi:hypothetical protein